MFNLTFFVIPILQAYVDNGYFSPVERFKKALRRNVIYYICLALVGLVVLAAVAVKKGLRNVGDILGFAMAGANIFGLSIVVVLLAYGLVELPKHLWHISDRRRSLKYLEFRVNFLKVGVMKGIPFSVGSESPTRFERYRDRYA